MVRSIICYSCARTDKVTCLLSPCGAMCVCNLLYIQEWGHSRCAYYCYLFACCAWFILWGDRGERWGALSNEAPPPHPRKRTHFVCSWVPEWAAGGASPFIFIFISFHAVPFLVSGSAGQDPYPNVFISSCFAGMPFLVSGVPLESKISSTFHACLSRSCLESTASALASSECVCVCVIVMSSARPRLSGCPSALALTRVHDVTRKAIVQPNQGGYILHSTAEYYRDY